MKKKKKTLLGNVYIFSFLFIPTGYYHNHREDDDKQERKDIERNKLEEEAKRSPVAGSDDEKYLGKEKGRKNIFL